MVLQAHVQRATVRYGPGSVDLSNATTDLETVRIAPGLLWGFLGDSITNGSSASNFAYSYAPKACAMVGGLVARRDGIEAGTPGDRSAQVLARMTATLTDGAQALVVLDGTNDASQGVAVTAYAVNKIAQIETAKRAGAPLVLCTVPPRAAGASSAIHRLIAGYNAWINLFGPTYGCEVADVFTALADGTTGALASAYDAGDGVHPNDLGHAKIADVVARAMRRAANWRDGLGLVTSVAAGSANLIADPLMARATPTTSPWFEQPGGTGTAPTYAMVADASGVLPAGRWAEMDFDATASGGTRRLAVATTDFAAGDALIVTGHAQVQDVSGTWFADVAAGTASVVVQLINQSGVAIANSTTWFRNPGLLRAGSTDTYDLGPFVWPVTVPSGTTSLSLWFAVTLATGKRVKARLGCAGILHATRIGCDSLVNWGTAMVNT